MSLPCDRCCRPAGPPLSRARSDFCLVSEEATSRRGTAWEVAGLSRRGRMPLATRQSTSSDVRAATSLRPEPLVINAQLSNNS
jgi:hypothetical protein